jgi:hypothetical protein
MHYLLFSLFIEVVAYLLQAKIKVKLSLCFFNLAPRHEGVLESRGVAPRILELGTRLRRVVSFTPRPLTPRESDPGIHWIGDSVGPRTGLNAVIRRKIPSS